MKKWQVTGILKSNGSNIKKCQKHAVRATTDLQIIEVQTGSNLVEDDIIRLEWEWR